MSEQSWFPSYPQGKQFTRFMTFQFGCEKIFFSELISCSNWGKTIFFWKGCLSIWVEENVRTNISLLKDYIDIYFCEKGLFATTVPRQLNLTAANKNERENLTFQFAKFQKSGMGKWNSVFRYKIKFQISQAYNLSIYCYCCNDLSLSFTLIPLFGGTAEMNASSRNNTLSLEIYSGFFNNLQ